MRSSVAGANRYNNWSLVLICSHRPSSEEMSLPPSSNTER
jgi:hypothetical protein